MTQKVDLKKRSKGFFTHGLASLIIVAAAVYYLIFSFNTRTFHPMILLFLVGSVLSIAVFVLTEFSAGDFLAVLAVVFESIAFCMFILDSVGDITDFVCGIVMYGNPDNVPLRVVMIGICLVGILTTIIGNFMNQKKSA